MVRKRTNAAARTATCPGSGAEVEMQLGTPVALHQAKGRLVRSRWTNSFPDNVAAGKILLPQILMDPLCRQPRLNGRRDRWRTARISSAILTAATRGRHYWLHLGFGGLTPPEPEGGVGGCICRQMPHHRRAIHLQLPGNSGASTSRALLRRVSIVGGSL
jgi:hypothetical protein